MDTPSYHTSKTKKLEPTCTTDGWEQSYCTICNATGPKETRRAKGHLEDGDPVLIQGAKCYRKPLYRVYCYRINNGKKCNATVFEYRKGSYGAHVTDKQGQCSYTHKIDYWEDVCTGSSSVHYWGKCREVLCHNGHEVNGKYVGFCGKAVTQKLWCHAHGIATRHTWVCGLPGRTEMGSGDPDNVRPNGTTYMGRYNWDRNYSKKP
jgi:hypothetical protein